jgi:hypothetical protein
MAVRGYIFLLLLAAPESFLLPKKGHHDEVVANKRGILVVVMSMDGCHDESTCNIQYDSMMSHSKNN